MTTPAIELTDCSLAFRRMVNPAQSLKEFVLRGAKRDVAFEEKLGVSGVSVTVAPGEVLGVVGANGAGKSTLLRLIAGVFTPTAGRVVVRGIVTPVIDLVSGIDPNLTGEESVVLYGALLGRDPEVMRDRVGSIAEWAGLANYVDKPVRTYSVGMVARLGFGIVTDVVPDVLLLDEVFAVGDMPFRERSLERIGLMAERGAAVVLVSHDLALIQERSDRVLWLERGRAREIGHPVPVCASYLDSVLEGQIA